MQASVPVSSRRLPTSAAVDIRTPEGADILRDLLRAADVFVEGLRPGVVTPAGFDEASPRALNSRLVFASITGSVKMARSRHRQPTTT